MENWKNGEFVGIEEVTVPEEQGEAPPTTEERITTLENALISQKIVGGGITNITDSSDNKIKDIKILGNSEQVTTTGKNMIDDLRKFINNKELSETVGLTLKVIDDTFEITGVPTNSNANFASGASNERFKVEQGKTYTLQATFNDNAKCYLNSRIVYEDGTESSWYLIKANNNSVTFSAIKNGGIFIYPTGSGLAVGNPIHEIIKNIQLEEGTKGTPYEPYTGGKPSPNPEYPQEIKNVGKYNEETGKYDVDVVLTGKNRFNKELLRGDWQTGVPYYYLLIYVKKGSNVSFSYNKTLPTGLNFYVLLSRDMGASDKAYQWLYHSSLPSLCKNKGTFVAESDVISLSFTGDKNTMFENLFDYLQIEISDAPTEYEKYKEQTITLSLDKPLRGTKDYKDVIRENEIVRKICEPFELDLTNAKDGGYWKTDTIMFYVNVEKKTVPFNDLKSSIACNLLPDCGGGKGNIYNVDYECLSANGNAIFFRIARNRLKDTSTPAKAKESLLEYMAGKQMIVQYAVLEPTTESFPEEFRKALEKLSTHYPTTVVTVDDGEVYGGVEVTYTADTKNYIDQQIASVVKTVVETQKALL